MSIFFEKVRTLLGTSHHFPKHPNRNDENLQLPNAAVLISNAKKKTTGQLPSHTWGTLSAEGQCRAMQPRKRKEKTRRAFRWIYPDSKRWFAKKRLVVPHFPVIVANEGWQGYPSLKMVKNPGGDYCWTAQNMPNKYMHLLYDVPAPRKITPKKPLRAADLTQWVLKDITQKSLKTPASLEGDTFVGTHQKALEVTLHAIQGSLHWFASKIVVSTWHIPKVTSFYRKTTCKLFVVRHLPSEWEKMNSLEYPSSQEKKRELVRCLLVYCFFRFQKHWRHRHFEKKRTSDTRLIFGVFWCISPKKIA